MSLKTGKLSPHQAIILSKFDGKSYRELISPGAYEDNFVVEVTGKINVGEDHPQQVRIPWDRIACYLIDNFLPDEFVASNKMKKMMREACETEVDQQTVSLIKGILDPLLGTRQCTGSVTGATIVRLHE